MPDFAVIVRHKTQPGQRDAVKAVWLKHMAPAIAGNAGHLAYVYGFETGDSDAITAFQLYASQQAASDFLTHPSYLAYLKEVEPLLAGPPDIIRLDPRWIKQA